MKRPETTPEGEVEAVDWSRDDEPVWTVRCLVCQQTVEVAVHSTGPRRCKCGVFWSVEVIAVGTRGVAVR